MLDTPGAVSTPGTRHCHVPGTIGSGHGFDAQWADGTDHDVLGKPRDAATAEVLIALRWNYS